MPKMDNTTKNSWTVRGSAVSIRVVFVAILLIGLSVQVADSSAEPEAKTFVRYSALMGWNDAREVCRRDGGELAELDPFSDIFLSEDNQLRDLPLHYRDVWTGLFCMAQHCNLSGAQDLRWSTCNAVGNWSENWHWIDHSSVTNPWCGSFHYDTTGKRSWHKDSCSIDYRFLCQQSLGPCLTFRNSTGCNITRAGLTVTPGPLSDCRDACIGYRGENGSVCWVFYEETATPFCELHVGSRPVICHSSFQEEAAWADYWVRDCYSIVFNTTSDLGVVETDSSTPVVNCSSETTATTDIPPVTTATAVPVVVNTTSDLGVSETDSSTHLVNWSSVITATTYIPPVTTATAMPDSSGATSEIEAKEFVHYTSELGWNDARKVCMRNGGELAQLDDSFSEIFLLESSRQDCTSWCYGWIGLFHVAQDYHSFRSEGLRWSNCNAFGNWSQDWIWADFYTVFNNAWCVAIDVIYSAGLGAGSVPYPCNGAVPFYCQRSLGPCTTFRNSTGCDMTKANLTSVIVNTTADCRNACVDYSGAHGSVCWVFVHRSNPLYCELYVGNRPVICRSNFTEGTVWADHRVRDCYSFRNNDTTNLGVNETNSDKPEVNCSSVTSATTDVTTVPTAPATSEGTKPLTLTPASKSLCACRCQKEDKKRNSYNATYIQEVTQQIKKELTVDRFALSSTRRRKVSATDSRQTAKVSGTFGMAICGVLLGLLVIQDVKRIYEAIRFGKHRMKIAPAETKEKEDTTTESPEIQVSAF